MNSENNFETFLYISNKKLSISVQQNYQDTRFYEKSTILDENFNGSQLSKLNEFLDSNIFRIEKSLKKFVKNIILIIDHQDILKIKLSLKKNIYGNLLNRNTLSSLLKDARNQIKENYDNKIITHMVIDKYVIDGKYFSLLPDNIKCENISLDLVFICLSEDFIKKLEQSLNKYQIKIKQVLSADYIESYFKDEKIDIYSMSQKIIQGHNKNEIILVPKKTENKGFFEKFFNFFG